MAKPPRRTRERILETALTLFNRDGEPHVTTADIADEMNISPGNLYYHYRNKDDIIGELFDRFERTIAPLLESPASGGANIEDFWLFIHLLFERMWEYRFFYRDLDEITSRAPTLALRFRALVALERKAVIALCIGLRAARALEAREAEIEALATNAVLLTTYWMSFSRLSDQDHGPRRRETGPAADTHRRPGETAPDSLRFERGVAQVLSLLIPYLDGAHRAHAERLRSPYASDAA
jgi:AcrR family transcriptional regulator